MPIKSSETSAPATSKAMPNPKMPSTNFVSAFHPIANASRHAPKKVHDGGVPLQLRALQWGRPQRGGARGV